MVPSAILICGVLELIFGCIGLGSVIHKPPVEQPPRVFIGRILMPVSVLFIGVGMLIQPATAQTAIPSLLGIVLSMTGLFLQLRYRPQRV